MSAGTCNGGCWRTRDAESSHLTLDREDTALDSLLSHSITDRIALASPAGQKAFTLRSLPGIVAHRSPSGVSMILGGQHVDFPLESAKATDIVKVGLELLEEDPYAFVLNKEHLREWVATEKEAEIQSLRPEERA